MADIVRNPKFWRDRAEHTRARAEGFRVSETDRQSLLKIAEEYEQIAIRAEQWDAASETGE
jgi:hypothetical protein